MPGQGLKLCSKVTPMGCRRPFSRAVLHGTKPVEQSKAESKCLLRCRVRRLLPRPPGATWGLLDMAGGTGQGVTRRWEALLHSCVPKCSLKMANLAHAALHPASAQEGQVCSSWERSACQEGRVAPTTPPATGWTFLNGRLCSQPGLFFSALCL